MYLSSRAAPRSYQLLAMIPVRAGRAPVRMVEWPGAGLGRGVRLVAGRENDAVRQPPEAAGEMLAVLGEEIGRELIDRDGDDQAGALRRLRGGGRRGEQDGGEQLQLHGHPRIQARSRRRPMATQAMMTTGTSTAESTTLASACPRIRSQIGRTP